MTAWVAGACPRRGARLVRAAALAQSVRQRLRRRGPRRARVLRAVHSRGALPHPSEPPSTAPSERTTCSRQSPVAISWQSPGNLQSQSPVGNLSGTRLTRGDRARLTGLGPLRQPLDHRRWRRHARCTRRQLAVVAPARPLVDGPSATLASHGSPLAMALLVRLRMADCHSASMAAHGHHHCGPPRYIEYPRSQVRRPRLGCADAPCTDAPRTREQVRPKCDDARLPGYSSARVSRVLASHPSSASTDLRGRALLIATDYH